LHILNEARCLIGSRVHSKAPSALLELAGPAFQVWQLPAVSSTHAASLMRQYAASPMDSADMPRPCRWPSIRAMVVS